MANYIDEESNRVARLVRLPTILLTLFLMASVLSAANWTIDGNSVYWRTVAGSEIRAEPATSWGQPNHYQDINWTWNESYSKTVNLSLVFHAPLNSGGAYLWKNLTTTNHITTVLYGVVAFESTSRRDCSFGDANNNNFYLVNTTNQSNIVACFDSSSNIGPVWFLTSSLSSYAMGWGSISNQFTHTTYGSNEIYTINNVVFNPSTKYATRFIYNVEGNGKFDLYAHGGSPQQVINGQAPIYLTLDPWYGSTTCTETTILDGGLNYTIISATSNCTLNVTSTITNATILSAAGGAGGGHEDNARGSGGGGAGGVNYSSGITIAIGAYNLNVGLGGLAGVGTACGFYVGRNGTASYIGNSTTNLSSAKGGGGGSGASGPCGVESAFAGGSGGGSGNGGGIGGTGTTGQGNSGGSGFGSDAPPYTDNGGGGGCNGTGASGTSGQTWSSPGGIGCNYTINGTNRMYSRGGMGEANNATTGPAGVYPGDGGTASAGTAGKGADGIIIIRYLTIASNTPPNITYINLTPTTAYRSSILLFNVTAQDAESTSINLTGNCSKNGVVQSSLNFSTNVTNNTNTNIYNISSGNLTVGANWSCYAIAYDGSLYSNQNSSSNVTILNNLPTAPTSILPNGSESFRGTASNSISINWTNSTDADNDTIVYWLYYSTNAGSTWNFITNTTANPYTWDSTNVASTPSAMVRVYANDSFNVSANLTSSGAFTIQHTTFTPAISDGYFAFDTGTILDNSSLQTLLTTYLYQTIGHDVVFNTLPQNLSALNGAINYTFTNFNHQSFVIFNFTQTNYTDFTTNCSVINSNLSSWQLYPYTDAIAFIVVDVNSSGSGNVSTFVNNIAACLMNATNNKFSIYSTYGTGLNTAFVSSWSMIRINDDGSLSSYMSAEQGYLRNSTSTTRIYSGSANSFKNLSSLYYSTIIQNLRNKPSGVSNYASSNIANISNGDLVIFNTGASDANLSLNLTSKGGSSAWDFTLKTLYSNISATQNTTVLVNKTFASLLIISNFTNIFIRNNNISTLYSNKTAVIGEQDYFNVTSGDATFASTGAYDLRGELWDTSFGFNSLFFSSYEQLQYTYVIDFNPYQYIIIAQGTNTPAIVNTSLRVSTYPAILNKTYGYISVGDYNNFNASGVNETDCSKVNSWEVNKTNEALNWTSNYSTNVFIDGLDIGFSNAPGCFEQRIQRITNTIQSQNKQVILNTYTIYKTVAHYGNSVMRESCFSRWDGTVNSPSYSYENFSLMFQSADFIASSKEPLICMAFGDVNDYDKMMYDYYAFAVMYGTGNNNSFRYGQPNFQTQREIRTPNFGAQMQSTWDNSTTDDWTRRYSNGIVHFNPYRNKTYSNGEYFWFDDGKVINSIQFTGKFQIYNSGVCDPAASLYLFVNENNTATINPCVDVGPVQWSSAYVTKNISSYYTPNGHYYIRFEPITRGYPYGLNVYNALNTQSGVHSWWDNTIDNPPVEGNWQVYGRSGTVGDFNTTNWKFNLTMNSSSSAAIDSSITDITQNTSNSSTLYGLTISSTKSYNLPIISYQYFVNSLTLSNITANGTLLAYTTTSSCNTSNPSFNYTTINGSQYGVCRIQNGAGYTYVFSTPHLSNQTYYIETNIAPTIENSISFTNATIRHWFYANASANDTAGASDITSWGITTSSGACVNYSNISNGNNLAIVFNCSSTSPSTPILNITFTGSSNSSVSTSGSNTYPDNAASLTPPTISGTAITGNTLTCNNGTFSDIDGDTENVGARTWQWFNGTTAIGGATSSTWLIPQGYNGAQVKCLENATNSTWPLSNATSNSTVTTIQNSAPVLNQSISFTNASAGHWFYANASASDADGVSDIIKWSATTMAGTCVNYSNSTSGTTLSLVFNCSTVIPGTPTINISFTDSFNISVSTSGSNIYPQHNNAMLTQPTITGIPQTGQTLTCNNGTFSDADGDSENTSARTWQWYNGTNAISGNTTTTFLIPQGWNGASIKCQETTAALNWTSNIASNNSSTTVLVNSNPYNVTISFSNPTSSHQFTAITSVYDPDSGADITNWSLTPTTGTCVNTSNSTNGNTRYANFTCTGASPSTPILNITFTDSSGASNSTTSSNAYPDHLPSLSPPSISGSAGAGNTLTCNNGTFSDIDGDPENVGARTWQWFNGTTAIGGATSSTWLVTSAYVGASVKCQENSTASTWTASIATNNSSTVTISTCSVISTPQVLTLTGNISINGGTCYNITSDNVTIQGNGFYISGATYGVYTNGSNIAILNLGLSNVTNGIFDPGLGNLINCNGTTMTGIGTGIGISLNASDSTILNCNIRNFSLGVDIPFGSLQTVRDSNISSCSLGISINNASYPTILNNNISNGININNSNNGAISTNIVGSSINSTGGTTTTVYTLNVINAQTAFYFDQYSAGNFVYLNNITAQFWVYDLNGNNTYYTNVSGNLEGNVYFLPNGTAAWLVYPVYSVANSTWASSGQYYPYSALMTPLNWPAHGADIAPYTTLHSNQFPTGSNIFTLDTLTSNFFTQYAWIIYSIFGLGCCYLLFGFTSGTLLADAVVNFGIWALPVSIGGGNIMSAVFAIIALVVGILLKTINL